MRDARRFLVVVRAGDASLHPTWTDVSLPRSFDLVVSSTGRDPDHYRDAPFRRIDDEGQTFIGLQRLVERETLWRVCDWVWLPDDDLAIEPSGIDRLVALVEAPGFDLARPALDWHGHYSFGITLRSPSFSVRCTAMVAIMAPCYSRAFLERCLPTFDEHLTGRGVSFVRPQLLGTGLRRCGILDDVTVTHTRAVGGPAYDALRAEGGSPHAERARVLARHGLPAEPRPRTLGAIDRNARWLDGRRRADAGRLARLQERDAWAFHAEGPLIEAAAPGRRPERRALPGLEPGRLRAIAAEMPFGA